MIQPAKFDKIPNNLKKSEEIEQKISNESEDDNKDAADSKGLDHKDKYGATKALREAID